MGTFGARNTFHGVSTFWGGLRSKMGANYQCRKSALPQTFIIGDTSMLELFSRTGVSQRELRAVDSTHASVIAEAEEKTTKGQLPSENCRYFFCHQLARARH